jgi:mRNA interferase MazF
MVDPSYIPQRGDLVWITLNPTGHEQAGRRPALVISHTEYNRQRRLAVMCAITSKVKGGGLEVQLPAGLTISGVVLVDQVKCLAYRERRAEFIQAAPASLLDEVLAKFGALIFDES